MKGFALVLLVLCLISPICKAETLIVTIPKKYVRPLYDYYIDDFNIEDAYKKYQFLRSGYDVEINGIAISTKGTGDINFDKDILGWIPFMRFNIQFPNNGERYISYHIGCVEASWYLGYLNKLANELLISDYTEINFNTKSKPIIRIEVKND